MEWLQTQRIGKALLQSGSKIEDAYYQNYIPKKNKDGRDITPRIINVKVDTLTESLEVEKRAFDKDKSTKYENLFVPGGSSYTGFYICDTYVNYRFKKGILEFWGKKLDKKGGIKDVDIYEEIKKLKKERNIDLQASQFLKIRGDVITKPQLLKKIIALTLGLEYIVENNKFKKPEKMPNWDLFSSEEQEHFKAITKINREDEEIVCVKFSVDGFEVNRDEDYKNFCIERLNKLAIDLSKRVKSTGYFSSSESAFEVSFPRDGINILKSSTGSPTSKSNLLTASYLLTENDYNSLKLGAKKIDTELKIRIAGISHYIIPEFTGDIDIRYFQSYLKDSLKNELAFSIDEYEKTELDILLNTNSQLNAILLLGHIRGKGDIDFVNSIRIPSVIYFEKVKKDLIMARDFSEKKIGLSFQQIFYLFPVASDKSKKPDALFFYKSIFEHTPYDKNTLMNVYADLIHLYRYGRPYEKAGRKYYGGTVNITYTEKPEYFVKISNATLKFQVLLNLLNNLSNEKHSKSMDYSLLPTKTQKVFERCNYQEDKAALFYLGKLIRLAADAQAKKQKNKRRPILDKINYGGMKTMDLKWLFAETIEKLKQYEVIRYADDDLTMFKTFFDSAEQKWTLSDIENVFYIFSGYALYWEVKEIIPSSLSKLVSKNEQEDEESETEEGEASDEEDENED